jgi:GNAT superfamily N-acetyltransferase
MTSDVTVRPARPEEAGVLTELVMRSKAYWGYSEEFMDRCRAELTIDPDHILPSRMTVAESEGRLLAVATLEGTPAPPGDGELGMLFVEPEVIGRGVGSLLFRHIADLARGLGFRSVELDADPHAEPFYEAMGAVRVGVVASGSIAGRTLNRYAFAL